MNANELYHKLITAGELWADLQSAYNALEGSKSSVLASLMMKSDAGRVAAREMEAKASDDFKSYQKSVEEAEAKAIKAKVNYEAMKVWIDLKRTEAANERTLARLV